MSSLRCKRCGKPVSDAYSKWSYCKDCGKLKQRYDNVDLLMRLTMIFSLAPIIGALLLTLANVPTLLNFYWLIAWQTIVVIAFGSLFIINRIYLKRFNQPIESPMPEMQPS